MGKSSQLSNCNVKIHQASGHSSQLQGRYFNGIGRRRRSEEASRDAIDEFAKEPHDVFVWYDEELDKDREDGNETCDEQGTSATV